MAGVLGQKKIIFFPLLAQQVPSNGRFKHVFVYSKITFLNDLYAYKVRTGPVFPI